MKLFRLSATIVSIVALCAAALVGYLLLTSPKIDQTAFDYLETAPTTASPTKVTVRYLGNTNLLVSDGVTYILTDGWFSRFSTWKVLSGKIAPDLDAIDMGLDRAGIAELAAVIPVHSHYDHAMDAPEVAKRTGALLVGSESTANIGRGWNLPETQIKVPGEGEVLTLGAFNITLVRSKHFTFPGDLMGSQAAVGATIDAPLVPPVAVQDYREGGSYSILIEHPSGTALLQGSAGFIPNGLDHLDVDVLFLGIGGLGSQTKDYQDGYWQHVVTATNPSLVVPVHWDSLTHPLSDTPVVANRLWSDVLNFAPKKSIELVDQKAKTDELAVRYLPMWEDVTLFPLTNP